MKNTFKTYHTRKSIEIINNLIQGEIRGIESHIAFLVTHNNLEGAKKYADESKDRLDDLRDARIRVV